MKSRTVEAKPVSRIKGITDAVSRDRLSLFAAQSSFYICISAIPLSMLIISLARNVAPGAVEDLIEMIRGAVPATSRSLFDLVIGELEGRASFPLVSTFALSALWASSRGVRSVVRGLSEVYGSRRNGSPLAGAAKGLVYTALFVVMITAALILLVFGEYLKVRAAGIGGLPMFLRYREILLFFVLSVFFTSLYRLSAGGRFIGAGREENASFRRQFTGGAVAAAGWILFSFFFSLYFELFPRFSYLYGSLAAVVFLMLWVYFCMWILLAGAEVNKYLNSKRKGPPH